uniref:hypothetical protein n=1 Tax=Bacteroides xylanisolvens TaxID=371601 RepID=UPI0035673D63
TTKIVAVLTFLFTGRKKSVFLYTFAESERKSDKLPGQAYIIINKKRKPYQLHPKKRKSPKFRLIKDGTV